MRYSFLLTFCAILYSTFPLAPSHSFRSLLQVMGFKNFFVNEGPMYTFVVRPYTERNAAFSPFLCDLSV